MNTDALSSAATLVVLCDYVRDSGFFFFFFFLLLRVGIVFYAASFSVVFSLALVATSANE